MEATPLHYNDNPPALRRPSIALSLSNGLQVVELRDSVIVEMVQNRELPPNRRVAPPSCAQRARRVCSALVGASTLAYALWSVINYIAPRGDSNSSGLPRQKPFDFDHL